MSEETERERVCTYCHRPIEWNEAYVTRENGPIHVGDTPACSDIDAARQSLLAELRPYLAHKTHALTELTCTWSPTKPCTCGLSKLLEGLE